jgi:predicted RNase H-like nuclease (RuvC/YqgF family)
MEIPKEQLTYIINGASVVLTALITWWATKKKEARQDKTEDSTLMRSDFDSLVRANAEFRAEVRKDLEVAKRELDAAKLRIAVLEQELDNRAAKIMELERTIAELSK